VKSLCSTIFLAVGAPASNFCRITDHNPHPRIVGLGTALPPHCATQAHIARFFSRVAQAQGGASARWLRYIEAIARRSGIDARYSVLADYSQAEAEDFDFYPKNWALQPFPSTAQRMKVYEQEALPLAEQAAGRALTQSGLRAADITHLIITTCTGFFAPGPDVLLGQRLGLRADVQRLQLGFMGCYAGVTGLRTAAQILRADPQARVMMVSVELCSLHFQRALEVPTLVSNFLFGDGAGAAVLSCEGSGPQIRAARTALAGDTIDQMGWRIGDHGFEMQLSEKVPAHLQREVGPFVEDLSQAAGFSPQEVKGWAIHPGGRRVVESVGKAQRLAPSDLAASLGVLRRVGNVSSATVLFVLQALVQDGWRGPGLALAFGPGLTMEGLALVH